ncbi:MAG: 4-hydroxy-3-methylbut-2-enyl diphosphate reductase [Planctomycetes bacterium]|nr:4-hydroxy-3-methylbut-2-enyl diphosphate reductase [Planctomycetota bacterium]
MQVIRASAMGMCFGVRDALAAARAVDAPTDTTIWGELVHNDGVRAELAARGFEQRAESDRGSLPATTQVLITAHGIAERERERLRGAGHRLVDTTCPLVARAHAAALQLAAEGRHVVVLGKRDHVEVAGLTGDLASWSVVGHLSEVERWPHSRLGVLCQTTFQEIEARRLLDAIVAANPHADVVFRDTICEPTRQRVRALRELIDAVDLVVVVGGRHSNNTRQLVASVVKGGRRAIHVERAEQLDPRDFAACATVGLTAGTSTQDEVIDAVEAALRAMPATARPRPDADAVSRAPGAEDTARSAASRT